MNIAGSGSIPGGVYQDSIHISGSGRVTGDVSCRVSGGGYEYGACFFVYEALYFLSVGIRISGIGICGDGAYFSSAQINGGRVVRIEGLGDQYLISLVQNTRQYHLKSLAASRGGEYIFVFKLHAYFVIIALHSLKQSGNTLGGSV